MIRPNRRISNVGDTDLVAKVAQSGRQSIIFDRISNVIEENANKQRERENKPKTFRSTAYLHAFDGDIESLRGCLETNPEKVNEKFSFQDLLSKAELEDPYYVPPLLGPSSISLLNEALQQDDPKSMSHDQVLL